jgi:hypothetical protein
MQVLHWDGHVTIQAAVLALCGYLACPAYIQLPLMLIPCPAVDTVCAQVA